MAEKDIVERLVDTGDDPLLMEAADTIIGLRSAVARLRAEQEGWRMVPEVVLDRIITKAMAWQPTESGPSYQEASAEIAVMLAASPPPPGAGEPS